LRIGKENSMIGSVGGAGDEAGGEYRRALAALFVAHALNGLEFNGLPLGGTNAVVETVALETDNAVDDILVGLRSARLYIQAKRTLRFGRPLDEVAEQWLRAVRDDSFDPERDFLAVGSGDISAPLRLAARALERRRLDPTAAWTNKESEQVHRLKSRIRRLGASNRETSLVLSRAVFIERKVEEDHQADSDRGRLLLDGHVVERGEGGRAWRELVSAAGHAARLRIGHTASGWLDELRGRGVPLTADAERSRAASLERQRQAVERYRERVRAEGETLDLSGLGAPLPLLPLNDLDADVTVRDPHDLKHNGENDLLWAFRRRGRVVLMGLPGGGKSTALRAVAGDWAARGDWTLPMLVSLRRLAERERFRRRPIRDELLDLATEVVAPEDRPLVRDRLDGALSEGEAVLFLDGLDEAADRSLALASDINRLLGEVHPDTDVLLATRDAAYSDARILRFKDLVLNPPREPYRTVRALLSAIAEQRDVESADSWVAHRADWVKRTLRLDDKLAETPLLPVLLGVLAGDSAVESLPVTRARILGDVIRAVVQRHEINRELELAALPEGHEAEALIDAFPRIAATLDEGDGVVPRAVLADALLPYLREEWGLAPAPARKTADEILRFWDESGIFVARGHDKRTSPRHQLFLEIGAALDAASRPTSEAASFVAALAPRPDRHETLILAAGLSEAIIGALIAHAVERHDAPLALAAATALAQGGTASDALLRTLATELIELMSAGDDEAWRVFGSLVQIPVPDALQEQALVALDAFGAAHATVGRALAALEWGYRGKRREKALESALRVSDLPRLPRRAPREEGFAGVQLWSVDQGFMRAKVEAARELLPGRPELAQVVVDAMRHASIGAVEDLAEVLRLNNHEQLADQALKEMFKSDALRDFARRFGDFDAEVKRTLETIAAIAPSAELTRAQTRRLDELASFFETLDIDHGTPWVRTDALERIREPWYRLIAALGGFDTAVLAAEAQVVQQELAVDETGSLRAFYSLLDAAEEAPLDHWERVADQGGGRDLAVHLLVGGWALAAVCAKALATHPDRRKTVEAIEARLPAVPRQSKEAAVWAILSLADDSEATAERFAAHDDAAVRTAVASLMKLTEDGSPTPLGRALAMDRERKVQVAALDRFEAEVEVPSPQLVALLAQMAKRPPQAFTCIRCGTLTRPTAIAAPRAAS
jgi:hypothetical protein